MNRPHELHRPRPFVKAVPAPTRSLPAVLLLAAVALLLLIAAARGAVNTVVWTAAAPRFGAYKENTRNDGAG